jgi:hypothetical protein
MDDYFLLVSEPAVVSIRESSRLGADTKQLIRTRAYELYERRGRIDGHDVSDWIQAEAETRAALTKQAA